jgi:hypothetical protein
MHGHKIGTFVILKHTYKLIDEWLSRNWNQPALDAIPGPPRPWNA